MNHPSPIAFLSRPELDTLFVPLDLKSANVRNLKNTFSVPNDCYEAGGNVREAETPRQSSSSAQQMVQLSRALSIPTT